MSKYIEPYCSTCNYFFADSDYKFCPFCGKKLKIIKNPTFENWAKGEYKEQQEVI